MTFFLITDLGHEGNITTSFEDKQIALEQYEADLLNVGDNCVFQGVALIEGTILKSEGTLTEIDKEQKEVAK